MGYSMWDIEKNLDEYRKKKQAQYYNTPPSFLENLNAPKPRAEPVKNDYAYVTPQLDKDFFTTLEKELPPIFTRQMAAQKTGGLISAKTLANLDSLERGPSVKVRVGTKVGYERASFLQWLRGRMKW